MKNVKRILAVFLLVAISLTLCACNGKEMGNSKQGKFSQDVILYFSNPEYNNMISENRTIYYDDEKDVARIVIEELIKGPVDPTLRSVIPKETTLYSVVTEGLLAVANFSADYYNFSQGNTQGAELIARYSIVKTLCGLGNIERVNILVEGEPILNQSGNPIGPLGENDIVFTQNSNENITQKFVTLYFADAMGEKLVAERRKASLVDNRLEKTVVLELVKGPKNSDIFATIPKDTKVLSVETKEGICFVNLSEEFITKFSGGSSAATLAIYSIVNSLTELPDIDRVQFLIDGVKVETFGDYIFSEPFGRDKHILE